MEYTLTEALQTLSKTPRCGTSRGCVHRFVRINSKYGVKFTISEEKRDESYVRQFLAHTAGCAPFIGDKVEFQWMRETWYGYIVEICPVVAESVHYDGLAIANYRDTPEYHAMVEGLLGVGIQWTDTHTGNWGWMDAAYGFKPVVIDFGKNDGYFQESQHYTNEKNINHGGLVD